MRVVGGGRRHWRGPRLGAVLPVRRLQQPDAPAARRARLRLPRPGRQRPAEPHAAPAPRSPRRSGRRMGLLERPAPGHGRLVHRRRVQVLVVLGRRAAVHDVHRRRRVRQAVRPLRLRLPRVRRRRRLRRRRQLRANRVRGVGPAALLRRLRRAVGAQQGRARLRAQRHRLPPDGDDAQLPRPVARRQRRRAAEPRLPTHRQRPVCAELCGPLARRQDLPRRPRAGVARAAFARRGRAAHALRNGGARPRVELHVGAYARRRLVGAQPRLRAELLDGARRRRRRAPTREEARSAPRQGGGRPPPTWCTSRALGVDLTAHRRLLGASTARRRRRLDDLGAGDARRRARRRADDPTLVSAWAAPRGPRPRPRSPQPSHGRQRPTTRTTSSGDRARATSTPRGARPGRASPTACQGVLPSRARATATQNTRRGAPPRRRRATARALPRRGRVLERRATRRARSYHSISGKYMNDMPTARLGCRPNGTTRPRVGLVRVVRVGNFRAIPSSYSVCTKKTPRTTAGMAMQTTSSRARDVPTPKARRERGVRPSSDDGHAVGAREVSDARPLAVGRLQRAAPAMVTAPRVRTTRLRALDRRSDLRCDAAVAESNETAPASARPLAFVDDMLGRLMDPRWRRRPSAHPGIHPATRKRTASTLPKGHALRQASDVRDRPPRAVLCALPRLRPRRDARAPISHVDIDADAPRLCGRRPPRA